MGRRSCVTMTVNPAGTRKFRSRRGRPGTACEPQAAAAGLGYRARVGRQLSCPPSGLIEKPRICAGLTAGTAVPEIISL